MEVTHCAALIDITDFCQIHLLSDREIRCFFLSVSISVNPRSLEEKIVTRGLEGKGGVNRTTPSTFDTIHPIVMTLGTYNKLHSHFQLSETTWCLIGFHGNNSQINDVTCGRHLGFLNFQILFKFSLLYFKMTIRQHLVVEIHKIVRIPL